MKSLLRFIRRSNSSNAIVVAVDSGDTSTVPDEEQRQAVAEDEPMITYNSPQRQQFKRIRPVVHWNPQSPIVYLDSIVAEQHCVAHCTDSFGRDIEGQFFFYPPVGTVWPVGVHELALTFVPKDSQRFANATQTRLIEVQHRRASVLWTPPLSHVLFLTPLPASLFTGLTCDLSQGRYEFSHSEGQILSVGSHKIVAVYIPSESESINYRRGYVSINFLVTGTWVTVQWLLPETATQEFETTAEYARQQERLRQEEADDVALFNANDNALSIRKRRQLLHNHQLRQSNQFNGPAGFSERFGAPIRFGQPLPKWVLCAECTTTGATGSFRYDRNVGDSSLSYGSHVITATFCPDDTQSFFGVSISQTIFVNKAPLHVEWSAPMPLHDGDPLDADALNVQVFPSDVPVRLVFDPPLGALLPVGVHALRVRAESLSGNYSDAVGSQRLNILPKRTLRIQWFECEEIVHPTPLSALQLNARLIGAGASQKGCFVYDPPMGSVLEAGDHILRVTFKPLKGSYLEAQASIKLLVVQGVPRLRWPAPESILQGDGLFENVLCCVCDNAPGRFVYEPPLGRVLSGGTHTLMATFIPDNDKNFSKASKSVRIQVLERPKCVSKIRWSLPEYLSCQLFGNALTDKELCAVCDNASGSFDYLPPYGTQLPSGSHQLTAKFVPHDPLRYSVEKICISVVVQRRTPFLVWKPHKHELVFGDLLDESCLNAYACFAEEDSRRVEGSCTYSSPLKSLLESGDHVVHCTFTPKDTHNFRSISSERSFFVVRAIPPLLWKAPVDAIPFQTPLIAALTEPCVDGDTPIDGVFDYLFDIHARLTVGEHVLQVRFRPTNILNYFGNSAEIRVRVSPCIPPIQWAPQHQLTYGERLTANDHCNARLDVSSTSLATLTDRIDGAFTYDPPVDSLLTCGGHIPFLMTFTPTDVENFSVVTITKYLQVEKRMPVIEWSLPSRLKYGEVISEKHLCACLSVIGNPSLLLEDFRDAQFTYSIRRNTKLSVGKYTLQVEVSPPSEVQNQYFTAVKEVEIEVFPRKPAMMWRPYSVSIVDGDPLLTDKHLNAKLKYPDSSICTGEISFSQPAGTILPIGRHVLMATFSPADGNSLSVSTSVAFDVVKRPPAVSFFADPLTGQLKAVKSKN